MSSNISTTSRFDSLPKLYQEYVEKHAPRNSGFRGFFIEVIEYFNGDLNPVPAIGTIKSRASIQDCIDHFSGMNDHPYLQSRYIDESGIKDRVLLVLGLWTLMYRYFVPGRRKYRPILQAYCIQKRKAYDESIGLQAAFSTLISKCGLLPHGAEDQTEESSKYSLVPIVPDDTVTLPPFILHESFDDTPCIEARNLNAFKLVTLAGVQIRWTDNISRHMLLSKNAQTFYLNLFSLPCALQAWLENDTDENQPFTTLALGISSSYSLLFNPRAPSRLHKYLEPLIGLRSWCWCLYCSSHRLCQHELKKLKVDDTSGIPYDYELNSLVKRTPHERGSGTLTWNHEEFESLWPRILALDSHLQKAKPWSFWVIFRDRRDTLQLITIRARNGNTITTSLFSD